MPGMVTQHPRGPNRNALPAKVVGLGAPISVWIYVEVYEISALTEATGEQLARFGASPQTTGCAAPSPANGEPPQSSDHVAELQCMLADLQRAAPPRDRQAARCGLRRPGRAARER
jgi:hypothetical protein